MKYIRTYEKFEEEPDFTKLIFDKFDVQEVLNIAKEKFPIGTKFTSLFGANDIVTGKPWIATMGRIDDSEISSIMVPGENGSRMIYDNGVWAEIKK